MHMERLIRTKFDIQACILTVNNATKNCPHRVTGCGTSHISKIATLESRAHATFDSLQILHLGLFANYKRDYQKLS